MQYIKIYINEKEYPVRLKQINDAPKVLYVQGNLELLNSNNTVAIVGSRKCTQYGSIQAYKFAKYLSNQGICIVSGLAIGIDTQAHIGAMKKIGKTIAVLGGGFSEIYPKENIKLYEEILKNDGCIVSEYLPSVKPNTSNFPKRNRIIAGLAIGTVVVEAAYRSGSTITARFSKIQNKPVFCIPSSIENKKGVGTNRLIQQGAKLITKPKDILRILRIKEINSLEEETEDKIDSSEVIKNEYRNVYKLIKQGGDISKEEIQQQMKINIQELNTILTMLELDEYIQQLPGNKYIRIK